MKHVALSLLFVIAACTIPQGDPSIPKDSGALGEGYRLRDVQNPTTTICNGGPCVNANVSVTSVVVTAIDNFDETGNGKSVGTIFVQDLDIAGPNAGISIYSPTFVPANLRLAPGDVVDMTGQYVQQQTIGTTVNFAPNFLPQMSKPQVSDAYETQLPAPTVVQLSDLDQFSTGRQWIGMLVTIQDVTVAGTPTNSGGRVTAVITNIANGPEINNELWDLQANAFPAGTHFTSITGIVDFFFNIFICPRSAADLVP